MSDDYGEKIPVRLESSKVLLDKSTKISKARFVLGYILVEYEIDENAEIKIHFTRDNNLEYEETEPIIVYKEKKRLYQRLPLNIGGIIDFFVTFEGEFKKMEIKTFKIFIKQIPAGKNNINETTQ